MKTLRMRFATDLGKTFSVSLGHVRDDVTANEVETAMEAMIDEDIFIEGLSEATGADLVDRTVTPLF